MGSCGYSRVGEGSRFEALWRNVRSQKYQYFSFKGSSIQVYQTLNPKP